MEAFRNALYKRGVPKQIYTDNGSIYCSAELVQVCARLGIILRHAPVGDGAAKGKIERFFRSCRNQFLEQKLDLSSIDALNRQFHEWVENKYNCNTHSILKMAPIDRFAIDRKMITYLPPSECRFRQNRTEIPRHLGQRFQTMPNKVEMERRLGQVTNLFPFVESTWTWSACSFDS